MAKHIIKPCRETLHGTLGGNIPPAIRIQPGDSIEFSALEADWRTGRCTDPKTESGVFFPRDRENRLRTSPMRAGICGGCQAGHDAGRFRQ